jgi:hypothetical protein
MKAWIVAVGMPFSMSALAADAGVEQRAKTPFRAGTAFTKVASMPRPSRHTRSHLDCCLCPSSCST